MGKSDREKKKSDVFDVIIWLSKALGFVLLALFVIALFHYNSIDTSDPLTYDEPVILDHWDIINPDGSTDTAGSSYRNTKGYDNRSFVAITTLPDNIKDDTYFCVIVAGDVAVYVNGELRKDFITARDLSIPGGVVKGFYMLTPLERSDAGGELKIVKQGTTRRGHVFQGAFVSTSSGLYNYLMGSYGPSFMLSEILLIFSVVVFIISIAMKILYRRRIAMMYGSIAIAIVSAWIITNSYIYPFVYHHYHIDGVINYLLCLMLPFGFLFYLDTLQKGRYRIVTFIGAVISTLNFFLWTSLHFTEVFVFPKALKTIDLILAIQILTVSVVFVIDLFKGKIKEYKYTAFGFAGFLVSAIAEIIIINFFVTLHDEIPMLLGLAIFLTMAVIQQIDDIRKINDERLRAIALSEAKTNFLASMSHEIRTPINAILGMNEMILRENNDPAVDDYASSVKSSGKMLLMLVNDVLDFSKIEAGKLEINDAQFSFSTLVRDIYPMLKERADEKKLELKVSLLREIPDGQISDEFRIRQVLINLINNAIKYTDTGTVLLLVDGEYTEGDKYLLKLSVKDTGRGISEEGQKNLFEAFSRADLKKNGSIEGTGLGLAIVKSIVDSMKGEINVVSKLGEGSEFSVKLPVEVYDKIPVSEDFLTRSRKESAKESECDYYAPDARILAVDDNASNLKIVKLFLKRAGIVPDLCDSGKKALKLCKKNVYDLILLDHMMPETDGLETLSLIKNDLESKNKDTTVIVLTANAVAGSRKMYMDAGFADYLTKPLDSKLLEQTVKKYLPEERIKPAEIKNNKDSENKENETENKREKRVYDDFKGIVTESEEMSPLKKRLTSIKGLDYEAAMRYSGHNEEMLEEVVTNIAEHCDEKIANMKKALSENDLETYTCEAHSVKGLMAMIGLKSLSDRAKEHEFAGDDNNMDFINKDCEDFMAEYKEVCDKLMGR